MFTKIMFRGSLLCVLIAVYGGCMSTEKLTDITRLNNPRETGPITVLTRNGDRYKLSNYRLTDTALYGQGALEKKGGPIPFKGELKLSQVRYVEIQKLDAGKTLLLMGGAAVLVAVLASSGDDDKPTYTPPPSSSGSGSGGMRIGSCPFVYSYDGKQHHLESEAFPGAAFAGAEYTMYDKLLHLSPVDGTYRLRLSNESPETEYINEIKLLVVDSPPDIQVIPDSYGRLHTIKQAIQPSYCSDFDGRDVLSSIIEKDGKIWRSDLSTKDFTRREDLRDGLILEFPRPVKAKFAKLVVNGVNTPLINFALTKVLDLVGDEKLEWYRRLETDSREAKKFVDFKMREGMLHVRVWQNSEWVEQGSMLDPGENVAKDQILVLDLSKVEGKTLKIKLESATDLWKIGHVYIDYSEDVPVVAREVAASSVVNDQGRDIARELSADDDLYHVTIQGQSADVTFDEVPIEPGMKRSYLVKAKGYYHQWYRGRGKADLALLERILVEPLFASEQYMVSWSKLMKLYE